jgi:AraC-like DNA-binding protein
MTMVDATTSTWPAERVPRVATAGRFFLDDQGFAVTYWHPARLAVHVHEYAATVRIGRSEFRLRRGDVTVSPPDTPSCYHLPQPGVHLCLHLAMEPAPARPALRLPLHLPAESAGDAVALRVQRIIDWFVQIPQNPLAALAASALAQELLIFLAQPPSPAAQAATVAGGLRRAVLEAARLIEAKPLLSPGVPELARAVGMSQNYLARGFKQHLGVTIARFRLLRRLQLAQELLTITDLPIKAIAARVGMADQHHFNKMFRQEIGMAPTQWRARGRTQRRSRP